jgi:methyl-accepting chemotaxis protein
MLEKINIGTRLAMLVGGVLLMSAITGFIGIRGISSTGEGLRSVYENNTVAMTRLGEVLDSAHFRRNSIVVGMAADSSSAAEAPFNAADKAAADLERAWHAYAGALGAEGKSQAGEFELAWKAYMASSKKTIDLAKSGDYEAATENMRGDAAAKFTAARQALLNRMAHEEKSAGRSFAEASQANAAAKILMLTVLGVGLVLSGWASWGVIRSITRPLGLIQNVIGEVEKNSDFTRRVAVQGSDEVGKTAASFNELMGTLQGMLRQVLDNVESVSAAARTLASSSSQVAAGSNEQSEAASSMAATVEQVTVSIGHVSGSAREAQEISRKSGEFSSQGGAVIHDAATEMMQIAGTVRETSATIESLGQQSDRISSIVQVIKDVAEQTNLLALNAAIEAARAGEQGRGFAVVADEVRKLAERTTKATEEITRMIGTIQGSARSAVISMGSAVTRVDSGVALARQAGEAINRIREGADQVIGVVNDISSALTEQSSASNDIAAHVEKVAQMSEENSAAAGESAAAASHLEHLASDMRAVVGRFRI